MTVSSSPDLSMSLNTQTIRKAIKYLKRNYLIILIAALMGIAFGFYYSSIKKPLYTAVETFSLEADDNSSGGGILSLAAQFGLDLGGGASGVFQGDNIMELFKSRRMIEATLLQAFENTNSSLADVFLDITSSRANNKLPQNIYPLNTNYKSFTRFQDSIMGELYLYISKGLLYIEKPDIKLNIYRVTFKSNNEVFSKKFTESLVENVTNFYVTSKITRSRYNVDILQKRTDSVRRAFDEALYGKALIQDANLNPAFQLPLIGIQKKQTDITVLSTAYGELLKNLELAKYTLLKQMPYIQVIDEPHFPLDKKSYAWYLYVPLSLILSVFLTCTGLLGLKLVQKVYLVYLK